MIEMLTTIYVVLASRVVSLWIVLQSEFTILGAIVDSGPSRTEIVQIDRDRRSSLWLCACRWSALIRCLFHCVCSRSNIVQFHCVECYYLCCSSLWVKCVVFVVGRILEQGED